MEEVEEGQELEEVEEVQELEDVEEGVVEMEEVEAVVEGVYEVVEVKLVQVEKGLGEDEGLPAPDPDGLPVLEEHPDEDEEGQEGCGDDGGEGVVPRGVMVGKLYHGLS